MRLRPSLSVRLVGYIFAAQIAALALIPVIDFAISVMGLSPQFNMSLNDWAEYRAHDVVVGAVTRAATGEASIRPTAALQDYQRRNPDFRYAVFDYETGAPVAGSHPELVLAFRSLALIKPYALKFRLAADANPEARGYLRRARIASGDFAVAPYGYVFEWRDLLYAIGDFVTPLNLVITSPMLLGATAIVWFMVRRGLAPLRAAARDAARIDMDSLDQRISCVDAPNEVRPFFDAVNGALARLDAGVAAQRRFTANAAHELRTPIAIMRAHADNPHEPTFRQDIRRDIRRIQTIVEQLLATARLSDEAAGEAETFDLGDAVLQLVADYTPLIVENKRRIEFQAPPARITIRANRWAIESVVANLLDNALRAEPVGGAVRVSVGPGPRIDVADHGPGVAREDRTKIFEPFWRKDRTGAGTGLGLSISQELIRSQHGALSVGDTPGGGATFTVLFR